MGGLSPSTDPGARPAPAPRRLPPARVRPPVTGALFCIRQRPRLSIRHRSRAAFSARLFCIPCAPPPAPPPPARPPVSPPALARARPRLPGRLRALVACLAGTRSTLAAHFQFFFLREDQRETGADARLRPGPPAPSRLSRPLRVRPPAPPGPPALARVRPPVTGALFCIRQRPRLSIRHRSRADFSARLFCIHQRSPVYPAACAPAYLPCAPAACAPGLSALRPGRLRPRPICPAPRPPARSGRLSRRHALDPGGPFSVLFLERGSKGNGSDRIGPPPPSSQEAFPKEKEKKLNNRAAEPRAAGQGGFFRRATGKGKRSGVRAR